MTKKASKRKRRGTVQHGFLTFKVWVLSEKLSYGHERYLVTPVAGSGQGYVEDVTLELEKGKKGAQSALTP